MASLDALKRASPLPALVYGVATAIVLIVVCLCLWKYFRKTCVVIATLACADHAPLAL